MSYQPLAFTLAAALVGSGVGLFVVAAGRSLFGVPSSDPTIRGLKTALVGLSVTVCPSACCWPPRSADQSPLPLLQLTAIHLGWGLIGWSSVLLAAVAYASWYRCSR
ncbi:hypothetical protein [Accumulibacter sp.]|uniref:hypothetical protein n=1 Tax=Accumulibacter sp. TaxID=2053492 RepID=UPI0025EAACB7|nr:hypothetical protein [Accumulibacter sp.]